MLPSAPTIFPAFGLPKEASQRGLATSRVPDGRRKDVVHHMLVR